MSTPKRHHFVPQFYLRRFSPEEGSICCFYKREAKFIPRASIKGQCAIDNYYSWHVGVEGALGAVEGVVANIMRSISTLRALPDEESESWHALLLFVALQASRTELSGQLADDMSDYLAKLMAEGRPELAGIDLDSFKIGSKYPAAMPMEISIKSYHVLTSLGRCLLINNSKIPYFCSDNPVVFYNSQRSHLFHEGGIGLDSAGLQIFYPIDDQHCIYLYDTDVYSKPSNTGIRIAKLEDIIKLNLVHYLWSNRNIYVGNSMLEPILKKIHEICAPYAEFRRIVFRETERLAGPDGGESSLLVNFRAQPPVEADFAFARHSKTIRPNETGARSKRYRTESEMSAPGRSYKMPAYEPREHLKKAELARAVKTLLNEANLIRQ